MSSKSVKYASRNVDRESGKNRVSLPKKKVIKVKQPEPSSEEEVFVDSELESELEMPAKDDTVRPTKKEQKKKKSAPRVGDHGVTGVEETGDQLAETKSKEVGSPIAPQMSLLLAATYHLGFSSIVRPAVSHYFPSCNNYYAMIFFMMELVSENTYLQEMCPGFLSVSFYSYCGYMYFYQILRAKDEVGLNQLTRAERRVLRSLRSIGDPEAWPVPAPLIEFVRAFGYYKSSNPQYSYVVPQFPDFSHVSRPAGDNASVGLHNYHQVAGIQRVPPIFAFNEFLRMFGARTSSYNNDNGWVPTSQNQLDAAHTFLGLNSSAANAHQFQALALSDGWSAPTEGEMRYGPVQAGTKRQIIRRWNVPNMSINIDSIEMFTGLSDTLNSSWIIHLVGQVNVLCRFFPGSTTLAAIDPISHIGNLVNVTVDKDIARTAQANRWYRGRNNWNFSFRGYDDTEQGRLLTRVGFATGTNYHYSANVLPVGTLDDGRSGPFFEDDANNNETERFERFVNQGESSTDPVGRFSEQMSYIFDPTGGRK